MRVLPFVGWVKFSSSRAFGRNLPAFVECGPPCAIGFPPAPHQDPENKREHGPASAGQEPGGNTVALAEGAAPLLLELSEGQAGGGVDARLEIGAPRQVL